MNIKEKILDEIKNNKDTLGIFAFKDEYLKLFTEMAPLSYDNFDFEIVSKKLSASGVLTSNLFNKLGLEQYTDNIIITFNGYYDAISSNINSEHLQVSSMSVDSDRMQKLEKNFVEFYDENENQITVMNNLLAKDGVFVEVLENTVVKSPIYLINILDKQNKNYFLNNQKLLHIGKHSKAEFIELNLVFSDFDALVSEIFLLDLDANSNVKYFRSFVNLQNSGLNKISFLQEYGLHLAENAHLDANIVDLQVDSSKINLFATLDGKGASIKTMVFAHANKERNLDLDTTIIHSHQHTKSEQLLKVIADNTAIMDFRGKIIINEKVNDAQVAQNSRAVLLSDEATVRFSPQLEIYNDDVKASHGVAIGALDEEQIFYLNSRGVDVATARKLLLTAFAKESIDFDFHLPDLVFNNILDELEKI